jgi:hypothetical protein
LPEFRAESDALQKELREASREKLRELIGDGLWWAPLYELTFAQNMGWLMYVLGRSDWIQEIASRPDPQESLLKELEDDSPLDWDGGPGGVFTESDLFGLACALQRNILSVMIYKQSICGLIEDARERADDDSLFKAIRVDKTVVSCPTAAARISEAEALGQKGFFVRLRGALKGPSQKHWEGNRDLRYSLFVLRELGFDQLSDDELEHLLVHVLKVYPKHENARKNLRKQFSESRRLRSL